MEIIHKLTCECKHLRKEHESGKEKLLDASVSKCMIKDCPCDEYHADFESRKQIWKIRYKALFWSGLIVVGMIFSGYVGIAMINISVDSTMSNYNVMPKYQTVNKWQNGTITNSTNYYDNTIPSELIKDSAWLPMIMLIFFIGLLATFFTYFSICETEYKRLIHQ